MTYYHQTYIITSTLLVINNKVGNLAMYHIIEFYSYYMILFYDKRGLCMSVPACLFTFGGAKEEYLSK